MRYNQSGYLAFKTTKVKDTKLALTVISFKVEWNNCLIFLALEKYDKKVAEFLFLLKNTITCNNQVFLKSWLLLLKIELFLVFSVGCLHQSSYILG